MKIVAPPPIPQPESFLSTQTGVLLLTFCAVFLGVAALYSIVIGRAMHRRTIFRRLDLDAANKVSSRDDMVRALLQRSLTKEGQYIVPFLPLNQLVLQSGTTVSIYAIIFMMIALGVTACIFMLAMQVSLWLCLLAGIAAGILFPLSVLRSMRHARQKKFEEQLPDALDSLVRSLRAGHAIPIAIASVGKQMADPLGGEFSLTAAELTYGLELETSMVNLRSRVGQPDLGLIVLAVSIQSKTGGNLTEILGNLSKIIRERFKLRLKAKALSAEGRMSAIVLSLLPPALFGIFWIISPGYYSEVWHHEIVKPLLAGCVVWLLIGNYIMYRMVRMTV
jgi:tight adherence protein B